MSEADDELSHLVRHHFTAADIAEHDQLTSVARTAASGLLSAYMTFHAAMEKGQLEIAQTYHDQFATIFDHMNRGTAFLSLVTLCDWMSNALIDQHGGYDGIVEASHNGTLFKDPNNQASIIQGLEKQLEEQS
jgi:hypothetical protein